jgi:D-glycero-D-manno-heptose 1,7-bisphosphate phosphatase
VLYLFDLDDTLISGYMGNPDKVYTRWEVLPGRALRLRWLREHGHDVGIVTNQAGVAFGHITPADVYAKLQQVAAALGLGRLFVYSGDSAPLQLHDGEPWVCVAVCFAHPAATLPAFATGTERRKPSGAMILELLGPCGDYSPDEVLYVGDREEDMQAARDADVRFQWAHIFFKDGQP